MTRHIKKKRTFCTLTPKRPTFWRNIWNLVYLLSATDTKVPRPPSSMFYFAWSVTVSSLKITLSAAKGNPPSSTFTVSTDFRHFHIVAKSASYLCHTSSSVCFSDCLSVWSNVSVRLPLDDYPWNLIWGKFIKIFVIDDILLTLPYFPTLRHKRYYFGKKVGHTLCVLVFSTNFAWQIFVVRRNKRDIIVTVHRSPHKVPVIPVLF